MSNAKHTPKPWTARLVRDTTSTDDPEPDRWCIDGPNGEAVVGYATDRDFGFPEAGITNEADGVLIAAAPDLLDVCRAVVTAYRSNHFLGYTEKHLLDGAKAAIAKAEGR